MASGFGTVSAGTTPSPQTGTSAMTAGAGSRSAGSALPCRPAPSDSRRPLLCRSAPAGFRPRPRSLPRRQLRRQAPSVPARRRSLRRPTRWKRCCRLPRRSRLSRHPHPRRTLLKTTYPAGSIRARRSGFASSGGPAPRPLPPPPRRRRGVQHPRSTGRRCVRTIATRRPRRLRPRPGRRDRSALSSTSCCSSSVQSPASSSSCAAPAGRRHPVRSPWELRSRFGASASCSASPARS